MADQTDENPKQKVIEYSSADHRFLRRENILWLALFTVTWVAIAIVGKYAYYKNDALQEALTEATETQATATAPIDSLEPLATRIDQLEQELANLHNVASSPVIIPETPAAAPDMQTAPLSELQVRVASLEQRLAATYSTLSKDIARSQRSSLVMTVALLREQIISGKPYADELETVQKLARNDAGLQPYFRSLQAHAEHGIPTLETLQRSFSLLVPAMLAANGGETPPSMVSNIKQKLSGLVVIRRVGADAEGGSADAVIARAEAALEQGNIEKAVQELNALQGKAAEAATQWIADARLHLHGIAVVNKLLQHAITTTNSPKQQ